jgi:hypothetical protein
MGRGKWRVDGVRGFTLDMMESSECMYDRPGCEAVGDGTSAPE